MGSQKVNKNNVQDMDPQQVEKYNVQPPENKKQNKVHDMKY